MGRASFWQSLRDLWRPREPAAGKHRTVSVEIQKAADEAGRQANLGTVSVSEGWQRRGLETGPAAGARRGERTLRTVDMLRTTIPGQPIADPSEGAEASLDWSFDDVTEAELQDFLAADDEPEQADPVFKSRLREQLWTMLQKDDLPRQ